jgi:hypothetical protein
MRAKGRRDSQVHYQNKYLKIASGKIRGTGGETRKGSICQPFQGSTITFFSPQVFSRLKHVVCFSWQSALAVVF